MSDPSPRSLPAGLAALPPRGLRRRLGSRPLEGGPAMSRVAVVTDSASDMDPARAASLGITIVPLIVNFGSETYSAGVDLSTADFWKRMTAPDAPFPTTAACS